MTIKQRLLTWAVALVTFVVSLASAFGSIGVRSGLPDVILVALAAASALAAGSVANRAGRLGASPDHVGVELSALFAVAAAAWIPAAMFPVGVIASYSAGAFLRRRKQLGYLAGALAVMGAAVPVAFAIGGLRQVETATPANFAMMFLLIVVLPMVLGLWIRARHDVLDGLRERAERLEREQEARADRARAEERNRIAHEMHDVVAHRVSLMVLHAGALEVSAAEARTIEAAGMIRTTGREAIADLRDVLVALRSPTHEASVRPPETLADIDGLVRQSRAAGITVSRADEGTPRPLPAAIELAAFRVVREALTNIHKHAGGADAAVTIRFLPGAIEVTIHNGPSTNGGEPPLPGAGLGLVGLRERVAVLGGTLDAGAPPNGGGFTLTARIPTAPAPQRMIVAARR